MDLQSGVSTCKGPQASQVQGGAEGQCGWLGKWQLGGTEAERTGWTSCEKDFGFDWMRRKLAGLRAEQVRYLTWVLRGSLCILLRRDRGGGGVKAG